MAKRKRTTPKVRSWIAVAAHQRNSAGAMGGSKRTKRRRDRAAVRRELKRYA